VSVETELVKGRCRFIADDGEVGDYAEKRCPGLAGAQVHTVARPSRVSLSLRWGKKTSGDIVQSWSLGTKLAWRGLGKRNAFKPYAAIVTAIVRDHETDQNHDVLAVLRIAPRNACLAAAIDVAANKDAMALARETADGAARTFTCGSDQPRVVGTPSAWAQQVTGYDGEPPK
jgi:hypothetical protein